MTRWVGLRLVMYDAAEGSAGRVRTALTSTSVGVPDPATTRVPDPAELRVLELDISLSPQGVEDALRR